MNIDKLIEIINEGKLAIIPTDTVYGLIADATNINAINKVFDAKERNKNKPLVILASNTKMLKKYILNTSELEEKIINKFWPGPLTILFKKNKLINNTLTANSEYIGIRLPDNKELIELINKLDKPIIATSTNISNQKTITNINLLEETIINKVDYIYDVGEMSDIASTLIKIENNKIIFLRDGLLSPSIKKYFKNYIDNKITNKKEE